ncbi:MAG: glycosyltransferase family 2 protein, partial [Duncaniella sp.]|nr:glycosyltransferase family 2 protein [Duncaniella sp.]
MIKVSVLIPVYGVEPYIERCIRSLFAQTLTEDIEFIFVD